MMRCYHWTSNDTGSQCKAPAEVWIVAPDGDDCPGGWTCRKHGMMIVAEYREKLRECWTLRSLTAEEATR
jgi:hypothetical protein